MRLCYICESTQGGVRKHLRELLRVFLRPEEGLTVSALFGDRGEPGFQDELRDFKTQFPTFEFTLVPEFRRAIGLHDLHAYGVIKDLLRDCKPDVIHTHGSKGGIIGREAARHLGIANVLHTPHVFPFQWETGMKKRLYLSIERHASRFCRSIICVGEGQRAEALATGIAPAERLTVIRNGVELGALPTAETRANLRTALNLDLETPCVAMVARLAPQKGVGIFLRAAAAAIRQHPRVTFVLVGSGPDEEAVRARITELQLPPERFRLLGHREDAESLYPAFDVLVLSSLYEGLPYVLLEAMARGVPVVATDVMGSRDVVVDGITGFLAPVSDPAQIAEKVLLLLNNPELHARQSAAARRHVADHFSFEAFVEGHRKLYRM